MRCNRRHMELILYLCITVVYRIETQRSPDSPIFPFLCHSVFLLSSSFPSPSAALCSPLWWVQFLTRPHILLVAKWIIHACSSSAVRQRERERKRETKRAHEGCCVCLLVCESWSPLWKRPTLSPNFRSSLYTACTRREMSAFDNLLSELALLSFSPSAEMWTRGCWCNSHLGEREPMQSLGKWLRT